MENKIYNHDYVERYIIENQEKIFKDFDNSLEIVSGREVYGVTDDYNTKYGSWRKGFKECDLAGVSDTNIYFIEVKSHYMETNSFKKYVEASKNTYYYKLKGIKLLFMAPTISNIYKKRIAQNGFCMIELGKELWINEDYTHKKDRIYSKKYFELYAMTHLNTYSIDQTFLSEVKLENDIKITFDFNNGYFIDYYLINKMEYFFSWKKHGGFCKFQIYEKGLRGTHNNILHEEIVQSYYDETKMHKNFLMYLRVIPHIKSNKIGSKHFKVINYLIENKKYIDEIEQNILNDEIKKIYDLIVKD